MSAEFVSADEAKAIASAIHFEPADGKTATTRSGAALDKEVQSITPVSDASGATAFYVINYRGGGFMLLSADKRVNPVLAFSETSTFPMNDPKGFPGGLASWMDDTKEHVHIVHMAFAEARRGDFHKLGPILQPGRAYPKSHPGGRGTCLWRQPPRRPACRSGSSGPSRPRPAS